MENTIISKIKKIHDDSNKIKDEFNKKAKYHTLESFSVVLFNKDLHFKYIIKTNFKHIPNELITMYINSDKVIIYENIDTNEYKNKHYNDYYEYEEYDDYGNIVFNKPSDDCFIYSNIGIFDNNYCSSGEGYELSVETNLCSILHELKIIHIDIILKKLELCTII